MNGGNQMQKTTLIIAAVAMNAVAVASPLPAQTPHPSCDHCQATYIRKSELDAYFDQAKLHNIIDQQVRDVALGHMQVGIGTVYRGRLDTPEPHSVAEHEQVSELYYILDGTATLKTGPDLISPVARPGNMVTVMQQNGPGFNADSVDNALTMELKPGDVVIIPAGTGHWFTHIPDHIAYLMVRLDPDKILPLKSEAQSKAHLAKPYQTGQDNY
jgi:mannose-6-phosphate isomerase-like protein (cupin superfamily)